MVQSVHGTFTHPASPPLGWAIFDDPLTHLPLGRAYYVLSNVGSYVREDPAATQFTEEMLLAAKHIP